MPIDILAAPAPAIQTLNEILPKITGSPRFNAHLPNLANSMEHVARHADGGAGIKPFLSAPVYVLGLKDLVDKNDISHLAASAWTHVLSAQGSGGASLVSADTSADDASFESLKQGPDGGSFRRQFDELSNAPDLKDSRYELAVLRIPALHVECFWLKGDTEHADILVPFVSHSNHVESGKRYSLQDFLASVRPAAADILRQDDASKGG